MRMHDHSITILSRRFPAKRAFITGGGSGLGRALAVQLAAGGWRLGIADLHEERLASVKTELEAAGSEGVSTYAGDVAEEIFMERAIGDFIERSGGIDLLVNNAGVAVAGEVAVTPLPDWRWAVGINLLGVVYGCHFAVPTMRRQGSGLVLNIASSAGFAAAPQMATYNVTKAGVIALSETMAGELEGSGVQVSVAMPGFFRTRLLDSMRAPPAESDLARKLLLGARHDATAAAQALLAAIANGDLYIIWPRQYRLAWWLKRLAPRWFIRRLPALRNAQVARASPPPG
jgi:short-subunit dehydrogenase